MTICPSCKGRQKQIVLMDGIGISGEHQVICTTCRGFGQISADHAWKIIQGHKIRRYREKSDLGIREAAAIYGIRPKTLATIERGDAPKIIYHTMCKRFGIAIKETVSKPLREKETAS